MNRFILFAALLPVLGICSASPASAGEVYCREYQQDVTIGGVLRSSYGTACQQPDGAWKIVTTDIAPTPEPVEYLSVPRYTTAPQLMAAPPAYYAAQPYYAPYPFAYPVVAVRGGHGYYRRAPRHPAHW